MCWDASAFCSAVCYAQCEDKWWNSPAFDTRVEQQKEESQLPVSGGDVVQDMSLHTQALNR
jgi:hypothetical protein